MGTGDDFPRDKAAGADHSASIAEKIKYGEAMPPLPIYLHGIMLN
jgi:hypothetical protein